MRTSQKKGTPAKLPPPLTRNHSHAHFSHPSPSHSIPRPHHHPHTIAESNQTSLKQPHPVCSANKPLRILLPDYFNIPRFTDQPIIGHCPKEAVGQTRASMEAKRKLKDLEVLVMGMRRAKNIKEESRYYFTEGVLFHNSGLYDRSIAAFQKFLKIVLFIRDDKSTELALNAIGAEYMHLKNYPSTSPLMKKAIEYHQKQGSIGSRADLFASHLNIGLCHQLAQDYESAIHEYREAYKHELLAEGGRKECLKELLERVQSRLNNTFVTTELVQGGESSREELWLRQQEALSGAGREKAKVSMAIQQADQTMSAYLQEMKNSFVSDL